MPALEPVEQVEGQPGSTGAVLGVIVHRLGQVQDAAPPQVTQVVQRRPLPPGRGVEQRPLPQGVARDDELVDPELGDDEPERFLIGSIEEKGADVEVLTPRSPLGRFLIGARVGDWVEFESPTGALLKVEVVEIEA